MSDPEKVINDFQKVIDYLKARYKIEYHGTTREILDSAERIKIAEDAFSMLKELSKYTNIHRNGKG